MTTRQTPDAVREAVARETLAKQYDASMPSRAAHIRAGTSDHKAIDAILAFAALDSRAGDAFDMPEYAPDDISHLEGLAAYIDGVARDKGRAGLPASKSLFEEIAKRLREYDVIRSATPAPAVDALGDADAEVERIMSMSDGEIMAEADASDVAWARAFKQGLRTGQHASTVGALVKALEWYRDQVSRCRMMHKGGDEARNALDADCGKLARAALSTLSADAIRQGEGERGFCNKCGFVGVPQKGGFHYRPKDGQPCNYICPVSATPASHASDGGKA